MALSDDQRAMLRLLAQREQGYEDIAALMGLSVDEVRTRVKSALAQLEEEGEPAPVLPPPPPVAEPEPPAADATPAPGPAAPTPAQPEPAAPDAVPEPEPTSPTPAHPEPTAAASATTPVAGTPTPKAAKPPRRPSPGRPKISLPSERGPRAAIAAGIAVVILVVVVLLVSGGGSDSSTSPTTASGTPGAEEPASTTASGTPTANSQLTEAILKPVNGGDGSGTAIFGKVKKTVVLQVEAKGLAPSPKGSSYNVWLYKSPKLALRIGSVDVSKSGGIAAQFPVPTELLAYVANGTFNQIDLSLTKNADYEAESAQAKQQKRLPTYVGESILRGEISAPELEGSTKK